MRSKKTPSEKKRLSLQKDHPVQAQYPHGFRKSWPLKERTAQRTFRRQIKQTLAEALGTVDPDADTDIDVDGINRKIVRKWPTKPLKAVIESKKARKITSYRRKKNAQLLGKLGA